MVEIDIVDSADGHNPVIVIAQDNLYEGEQVIQLDMGDAKNLRDKLQHNIQLLEVQGEEGVEGPDYSEEIKGALSIKRDYESFSKQNEQSEESS